jgi:hypothetical protein
MPRVTLTIPHVDVSLNIPPDFAAYVTLEDLREMALQILSVQQEGLGIDTICRIRHGEKEPEWTEAYVNLDEDDPVAVEIEDDGFAALEKEIKATTHGTLTLTACYEKLGQQTELVSISSPFTETESDPVMRHFMLNLESIYKSATGEP